MKTISLKLPETLNSRLNRVAKQRDTSKSEIIREAIESFLGERPIVAQTSFLQAAGDLLGTLDGPVDLASNPKHLKGYGR